MSKLEKLALLGDANPSRPSHGAFQFRLPPNQAKSFVQRFHQNLLVLSSLTHQFVAALPTAFRNVGEVQHRNLNGGGGLAARAPEGRATSSVDARDDPRGPEILLQVHAIVASPPRPSERDPTRRIEAGVVRCIVHRGFRLGVLRFALMGGRREAREVVAVLRRADGFGRPRFLDGGDVPTRAPALTAFGARRRFAGRFSAMAPAFRNVVEIQQGGFDGARGLASRATEGRAISSVDARNHPR